MYNPYPCSDSDCEWIEIYNNNLDIDINGWKFYEGGNHGLSLKNGTWIIKNNSYAIIAEDWTAFLLEYPNFNGTLFDSSFSLLNSGEFIAIEDNNDNFINNLTYNVSIGADNDGNSLQLINETWYASTPTPGYENFYEIEQEEEPEENISENIDIELTVKLNDILNIFEEYTQLFNIKILNKENCGIKDNITVFYNITNNNLVKQDYFLREIGCSGYANTGSIIFNQSGNFTICGLIVSSTSNNTNKDNDFNCKNVLVIDTRNIPCNVSIDIDLVNKTLFYNNKQSIKFYNILNNESFLYKIEYWIEDLFGNEAKSRYNTSNTNQKSWTPSIEESDQVFLIKNRIAEIYCNDTYLNDNFAEKLIVVKGEKNKESTINITEVYLGSDYKAKFGDTLRIRINIYKGDETKNNVKLWLEKNNEKISKVTSTNLYTNFINYDLTLAIQIDPNCNGKYPDGDYTLFLEAFNKTDSIIIPISGIVTSNCGTVTKYSSSSSTAKISKPFYEIISIPSEVEINKEFTSKIRLNNEDKTNNKYSVWSYVYRGNKCYSGEREQNLQELSIPSGSSALIELKNIALEEGDFKFKIKIRKDELKTTRDITQPINVISLKEEKEITDIKTEEEKEGLLAKKDDIMKNIFLSEKKPETIYLSSSAKARNLASFFILFLLSLLLIFIIWKKTI